MFACIGSCSIDLNYGTPQGINAMHKLLPQDANICIASHCVYHAHKLDELSPMHMILSKPALLVLLSLNNATSPLVGFAKSSLTKLETSTLALQKFASSDGFLISSSLQLLETSELNNMAYILRASDRSEVVVLCLLITMHLLERCNLHEMHANYLVITLEYWWHWMGFSSQIKFADETRLNWTLAFRTLNFSPLVALNLSRSYKDEIQFIPPVFGPRSDITFSKTGQLCLGPRQQRIIRIPPTFIDCMNSDTDAPFIICCYSNQGACTSCNDSHHCRMIPLPARFYKFSDEQIHLLKFVFSEYVEGCPAVQAFEILHAMSPSQFEHIWDFLFFLHVPRRCGDMLAATLRSALRMPWSTLRWSPSRRRALYGALLKYTRRDHLGRLDHFELSPQHQDDEHVRVSEGDYFVTQIQSAVSLLTYDMLDIIPIPVLTTLCEIIGGNVPILENLPAQSAIAGGAAYCMSQPASQMYCYPASNVDIFIWSTYDSDSIRVATQSLRLILASLLECGYAIGRSKYEAVFILVHPTNRLVRVVCIYGDSLTELLARFDWTYLQVALTTNNTLVATHAAVHAARVRLGIPIWKSSFVRRYKAVLRGMTLSPITTLNLDISLDQREKLLTREFEWRPTHPRSEETGVLHPCDERIFVFIYKLHYLIDSSSVPTLELPKSSRSRYTVLSHCFPMFYPDMISNYSVYYLPSSDEQERIINFKIRSLSDAITWHLPLVEMLYYDSKSDIYQCEFSRSHDFNSKQLRCIIETRLLEIAFTLMSSLLLDDAMNLRDYNIDRNFGIFANSHTTVFSQEYTHCALYSSPLRVSCPYQVAVKLDNIQIQDNMFQLTFMAVEINEVSHLSHDWT